MAILIMGPAVIAMRGAVAGTIFSANKNGPYARTAFRPPNANTALQQRTRSYVQVAGLQWTALTTVQKNGWTALSAAPPETVYNSLGKVTVLSGYQWYSKITCRQRSIGAAVSTSAPAGAAPAAITVNSLTVSADGTPNSQYTYPAGSFAANEYSVTLMTFRTAGGAIVASRQFILVDSNLTPASDFEGIQTPMVNRFGNPTVGWRAFILVYKQLLNGLRSPATAANTTVVA